jgi:predicted amidohydrolase
MSGSGERSLVVAAAQLGPIPRSQSRGEVVARLIDLLRRAGAAGAELVVYPEAALTAFFPHWWIDSEAELDSYFEAAMPNAAVQPLFDAARRLKIAFCLGYAELDMTGGRKRRFNSAILTDRDAAIVGKYRKIHLPGYFDHHPEHPFQNLEKRYFEVGNLGFNVWDVRGVRMGLMICNDRRWAESFRVLGLKRAELILVGYNTPVHNPLMPETDRLADFHNRLALQAGAYQNSAWVVGVAKAGHEEGVDQIGGTCIVAPTGEVVAESDTLGDDIVTARCDLGLAARYKRLVFNFAANRRPAHYKDIAAPSEPDSSG